jgi:heme O synthase-like polyprenyltransferase
MKEVLYIKKTSTTLDKISIVLAILVFVAGILNLIDGYNWLIYPILILISLNLILMGIQIFSENKKAIFPYYIIAISIIIISISIAKLIH